MPVTQTSRSPSPDQPDQYDDAPMSRSSARQSSSSSEDEFFDARRGFPILDAKERQAQARPSMTPQSMENRFADFSAGPSHSGGKPYGSPAAAQKAKSSGGASRPSRTRPRAFSKDARAISFTSPPNLDEMVGKTFTEILETHYGKDVAETDLSSQTGFSFACQFVRSRPDDEHRPLLDTISKSLMQEIMRGPSCQDDPEPARESVDRMIRYLVEKDLDAEPDDISYREIMAKLVYFKNKHLDSDFEFPENFVAPDLDGIAPQDRILIDMMGG